MQPRMPAVVPFQHTGPQRPPQGPGGAPREGLQRDTRPGGCGMDTRRSSPRLPQGANGLVIAGRPVPFGSGVLPEDFVDRLHLLKEATGLTWNGFAEALGVDPKQVFRWRQGAEPCGGAMRSLISLAARVPGGLDIIMGRGFLASLGMN